MVQIVRIAKYAKEAKKLLTQDEQARMEISIITTPDAWPVIPGTGGARKARARLKGTGKRGGARVIYHWQADIGEICFIAIYAKNQKEDLNHDDKKAIAKVITALKAQPPVARAHTTWH